MRKVAEWINGKHISVFLLQKQGVTSIEYGILAAGLAVAIGSLLGDGGQFSEAIKQLFQKVINSVPASAGTGTSAAG